jgi:hypothetical protein
MEGERNRLTFKIKALSMVCRRLTYELLGNLSSGGRLSMLPSCKVSLLKLSLL